nr:transposase (putative), gypsy type [Tanacetum cinerariifolium]
MLHPELPGPGDRIVDFPEGKVGVYTRFFEFTNFRLPLSQFLFDVLGYYQIHLSQMSVIGVAKVSHFVINCRVQNIIPTLSLFRVFYTPSFNSGWMSFSKRPGNNTPQCYTKPLDSLKNWNNRFFWVDECVFPTVVDWRTNASKDGMPANGTYSVEAVRVLDTHRTPIQKQPEMLLCLVEMDLFSLIRAPNPTKVKTGSRPRAPHELPLLTLTAPHVIEMDEPAVATDSFGVPSTIERSPLDFAPEAEASGRETAAPEMPPPEDVSITTAPETDQAVETVAVKPPAVRESRKRGSSRGGKSLAAMQLCLASNVFVSEGVPADVSDPDQLAFADTPSPHPADVAQSSQGVAVGDLESENVSSPAEVGSPGSVYQPEWGVTNGSLLDTPEACQDLVDYAAPTGYFSELRHMHNEEFLGQYNINLARQVAMGSQLRLRFEQEAKLLQKSVAQVARRDQRIQAWESKIKNLKALLETEVGMKRAAEEKSVGLSQELERMRAQFSKLQVSNERLSQQVDALQQQVSGEEMLKAAFKEYKRQQDQLVEQRWVIGHGLRLSMMKCVESLEMRQAFADVVSAGVAKSMSEGLKHGVENGRAQLTVESLEAYDPEAEAKFAAALQSLKDLKYPLLDQLEGLKDAPMDVIMAALYLESDTGGDTPQFIRDLRPSSSQLTIPVYPEVRDPRNPWACKEEIGLADAIAANISRAEQKKRSCIVCRTHGVGSAHHARSDRVPVSTPIVVLQGLALLLVDAATQTEPDDA